MSVSFVTTNVSAFPAGTSVGAYLASDFGTNTPSGVPPGPATNTQVMGATGATFTGLADETEYWLVGQVNGAYRYVKIRAGADVSAASDDALLSGDNTFTGAASFTGPVSFSQAVSGVGHAAAAAAGTDLFTAKRTGDTNSRWAVNSDGRVAFGSGSGAADLFASRTAAGVLQFSNAAGTQLVKFGNVATYADNTTPAAGIAFSSDGGANWVGWGHEPNRHLVTHDTTVIARSSTSAFNVQDDTGANTTLSVDAVNHIIFANGKLTFGELSGATAYFDRTGAGIIGVHGADANATAQLAFYSATNLRGYVGTTGTGVSMFASTGTRRFTVDDTGISFFAVASAARAAAYTQTYATATRTHANATSSAVATTAATQATPWGFGSQAQADAIPVAINAVAADLLNLKQLVNSVIDDHQTYGLFQ